MKTPRDKYLTDNHYKVLVESMVNQIEQCNYTPSEMREAAILASIMYEERHIRYTTVINEDIDKALRGLYKWVETPTPHNK